MATKHVTGRAKTYDGDNRKDSELKLVRLIFTTVPLFGTWEGYFELETEGQRWEDIVPHYACGVKIKFVANNKNYVFKTGGEAGYAQGLDSENVTPQKIYLEPLTQEALC